MRYLICFFCIYLFPTPSAAQSEWEWVNAIRSIDNNDLYSTTVDNEGNLVICGNSFDSTLIGNQLHIHVPRSAFLAKISPQGNFLWYKQLSWKAEGGHPDVHCDRDNNILLANRDAIFKFSSAGDSLWKKEIRGVHHSVQQRLRIRSRSNYNSIVLYGTFQGQLTVGGAIIATSNNYGHGFLLHLNEQGELLRSMILGRTRGTVTTSDFVVGPRDAMVISGSAQDTAFIGDSLLTAAHTDFVAYLDSSFNVQWIQNSSGDILAIDSFNTIYSSVNTRVKVFDSLGNTISTVQGRPKGTIQDLEVDQGQNVYIVYRDLDEQTSFDLFVVKINSSGIVEWDKRVGGNRTEALGNISVTADGILFLSGMFESRTLDLPPFSITKIGGFNIFIGKLTQGSSTVNTNANQLSGVHINVAKNNLYVSLPDYKDLTNISIFSSLGKRVCRYTASELKQENRTVTIPLNLVASGVYFLQLKLEGVMKSLPFVYAR